MEHLQEILRVWADLHNKPSKTPKERQLMNELASILPRYGGGPIMQKMKVVRAGGTLEFAHVSEVITVPAIKEVVKVSKKDKERSPFFALPVEKAPEIPIFADSPVEKFTDSESELLSFVDAQEEKKSPQSNADPVNVAEGKRGRKAKVKE
jgi:hypothetical protein